MLEYLKNLEWGMSFNDWINIYTESFGILYNLICMYLIFITILVIYWISFLIKKQKFNKQTELLKATKKLIGKKDHINTIEWVQQNYIKISDKHDLLSLEAAWSLVPLSFISTVSVPSVGLEYGISPEITPLVTVKIIGHQWYWEYEIVTTLNPSLIESTNNEIFKQSLSYELFLKEGNNCEKFLKEFENLNYMTLNKSFDSGIILDDPGFLRLVSIDNKLILPINTPIKFIITSADVLHSFAVPSGALKIDAIPGRLSQQVIILERPGLFWGQCSELCGPFHGFMPIIIEAVSFEKFIKYMLNS